MFKSLHFALLLSCVVAIPRFSYAQIDPTVRLDSGSISGTSAALPGVLAFKGIPYAAAPVGELRWKAPRAVAPWDGARTADKFGPICPQAPYVPGSFYQLEYFSGPQPASSEDCLYLNVWTAAKSADQRMPVMVWIHGGGNVQGYGSEPCFDGSALASHGVVLVTFNYRLGIFGLFAHPALSAESEHHVSGNYQELDQIAALKWVQKNIAAFGGDPGNVTVFGQSSGGASINRLLVTPLAHGLFQKVILQSAAVFNSRDSKASLADMEKLGTTMGDSLGAKTIDALRKQSPEELLAAAQKFKFNPNIDAYVLPELAADVFADGRQAPLPMMIGSNSDEGPLNSIKMDTFTQDVRKRLGPYAQGFLQLYPFSTDEEAAIAKHDSRRDESFSGERAEARMQAALGVSAYLYYFDRKPPGRDRDRYGAFHAAELEYVFNTEGATTRPWEPVDRELADRLIRYWTNFAKSANPNGPGLPDWPAYNEKNDRCMQFGDTTGARDIPNKGRLDFLEPILEREAR